MIDLAVNFALMPHVLLPLQVYESYAITSGMLEQKEYSKASAPMRYMRALSLSAFPESLPLKLLVDSFKTSNWGSIVDPLHIANQILTGFLLNRIF